MSSNRSIARGTLAAALICSVGCMAGGTAPWSSSPTPTAQPIAAGQSATAPTADGETGSAITKALWDNPVVRAVRGGSSDASTVAHQHKPGVVQPSDPLSLSHPAKPPSAELYVSMGMMAERGGNVEKAGEFYTKAIEAGPKDPDVLLAYAHFHDRQGRLEQASKLYLDAVRAKPDHARAHNDLGLCYARQGQLSQALQSVRQAVSLRPDRPIYRNNLAKVLVEMDRGQAAVHELATVLPQAQAHYNVGWFFAQSGKRPQAKRHFAAAVQLDPQMEDAHAWLARLDPQAHTAREAAAPAERLSHLSSSARPTGASVAGTSGAAWSSGVQRSDHPKPIITNVRPASGADERGGAAASPAYGRPNVTYPAPRQASAGVSPTQPQQPVNWSGTTADIYRHDAASGVPSSASRGMQGNSFLDTESRARGSTSRASEFDGQSHESPWGTIPSPYQGTANTHENPLRYPSSLAVATESSPRSSPATILNPYAPTASGQRSVVRQASAQSLR